MFICINAHAYIFVFKLIQKTNNACIYIVDSSNTHVRMYTFIFIQRLHNACADVVDPCHIDV